MKTLGIVAFIWSIGAASPPAPQYFTGTYGLGRTDQLPTQDLDYAPLVIPLSAVVYPDELRGSGSEARLHVIAWLKEDGSVTQVLVTGGSDRRFRAPVQRAVMGWRFCTPTKDSKPVPALVRFHFRVAEAGVREITFERQEVPKQNRLGQPPRPEAR